jgi:hypothetical protein
VERPQTSFVDPLSNRAFIREVALDEELAELVAGAGNWEIMPVFLHELAHFSSMTHLSGVALTALWLRASSDTIDRSANERRADAARVVAFTHLMRPWLEGIGCYAQFDASPGAARSLSLENGLYYRAFCRKKHLKAHEENGGPLPAEDFSRLIAGHLAKMRFSRRSIAHKTDVLLSPLNFNDGGYLAGYLCVKAFAGICANATELAADTDLMLSYVESVLLDDPQLVIALLQPMDDPNEAVRELAAVVRARIDLIYSARFRSEVPEDLDRYDRYLARNRPDAPLVSRPIHSWDSSHAVADHMLSQALADLGTDPLRRNAVLARNLFVVGTSPGTAKVAADGSMVFDYGNDRTQPTETLVPLAPGEHPGSITYLFVLPQQLPAVSIEVGGQVVSLATPDEVLESEVGELLQTHAFDLDGALSGINDRNERLQELLGDSEADLSAITTEALVETWQTYLKLGLFPAHEHGQHLFETMWEQGVWSLVGRRREMVIALALISAAASNPDQQLWTNAWTGLGLTRDHLREILDVSNRMPLAAGYPLPVALLDANWRFHSMF